MAEGLGFLTPTWATRKELQVPGFGLGQTGCCGHLGSERANERSFTHTLCIIMLFQIKTNKKSFLKMC